MFGYIKPVKAELKVKEWEAYQGIYCGLCKQLGREYGPLSRMTLSYDFVFLAVLSMALEEKQIPFCRENCMVHPFKKRSCCQPNESLSLSCTVAVLLLHHKLLDNLADGHWAERFFVRLALPFSNRIYRKASGKLPELSALIAGQMAAQSKLEQEGCTSVDQACEPTANCMAAIFSSLSRDPSRQRVLERLGYLLGRWVYLIDALDDYEEDRKSGSYNPFLTAQADTTAYAVREGKNASSPSFPQEDSDNGGRMQAVGSLYLTTAELAKTYELLDIHPAGSILEQLLKNIVHLGLKESVDKIKDKTARDGKR